MFDYYFNLSASMTSMDRLNSVLLSMLRVLVCFYALNNFWQEEKQIYQLKMGISALVNRRFLIALNKCKSISTQSFIEMKIP